MGPDVEKYGEELPPHLTYGKNVTRKVICAACKHPIQSVNLMVVGPRHWDKVMQQQYHAFDMSTPGMNSTAQWEQGFIDQWGTFMDRKEAMQVAKAADQEIDIERGCGGDSETLYSEGLY